MVETKKYARVLGATYGPAWYADKVGRVFEVESESCTYLVRTGPHHLSAILKEDAELIVTEKRPAKVGERVLITVAAPIGKQAYETGDIFVAESLYDPFTKDIRVLGMPDFIDYSEYEVIVNNEVKNEEVDGMENVNQTAIDSASTVFEKVGEDYIGSKSRFGDILIGSPYSEAFVKAYANERKDVLVIPQTIEYTAFLRSEEMKKVATSGQAPIVSAQARRDEIVEQAKADVEKLSNYGDGVRYETGTGSFATCNVEFVVNRDKRTVVALLKGVRTGKVYAKGIAKAAPDDCFNVHIGRAIALRRALGLAVPDEYLNAPQPTEVRVGDFISDVSGVNKALVIEDDSWPPFSGGSVIYLKDARKYGWRTIDDSREEVVGE
ncbi:hypothetical protein CJ467_14400 [Bacillus velezensis]|uniref:hypothetical protein n=1 Tax=Bacillus velezensis TaxID=492670 RepID=UPI000BA7B3BA|nr:hypothetical protein [Bacillus velezensis]PAK29585.1 hypothetical protein CJ467_14400 [Bacillus velezensis]